MIDQEKLTATLRKLIEVYRATDSLDEAVKAAGLDAQQLRRLREAFRDIDLMAEREADIQKAREEGQQREAWLAVQLREAAHRVGATEEQTLQMAEQLEHAAESRLKADLADDSDSDNGSDSEAQEGGAR